MLGAAEKIINFMKHISLVNSHGGSILDIINDDGVIEFKNVKFKYPVSRSL